MNNNLNKNRVSKTVNDMTNYKVLKIWTGSNKGSFATLGRLPSHVGSHKPNFVIKWGPPASGKGSQAVKDVIASLGWPLDTYVNFNIDDVVEATNYFKEESNRRARNYLARVGVVNIQNENKVVAALNTIKQNNALILGKPYSQIRNGVGQSGKLSTKLNTFLENAISLRKNITFETTGMGGFPNWLFTERGLSNKNYDIHIVFPLVPFNVTWERYRRRAAQMLARGKGFRFASWKDEAIKQYQKSYDKFISLVEDARRVGTLQTITVIPYNGRPIKHVSNPRPGLRSENIPTIRAAVRNFRNSSATTN